MKTRLLRAECTDDLRLAAEYLRAGQLVAVPTETVYGLAANAANVQAVEAIYTAKQCPKNHPLIVHIGAVDQLADWAAQGA